MPEEQKPIQNQEFGLRWSRKGIIITLSICLLLSAAAVFGFLFLKEKAKQPVSADFFGSKKPIPDFQRYTNNYWGFSLQYPGNWSQLRGTTEQKQDDSYYFSPEPISFIEEMSETGAVVKIANFQNWQHLSFEQWLSNYESTYFNPGEIKTKQPETFQGLEAKHYTVEYAYPNHNLKDLDMLAVYKDDKHIYIFSLVTANQAAHDNYVQNYKAMLNSIEFFTGTAN